jgi:beta-fructofuranosidase
VRRAGLKELQSERTISTMLLPLVFAATTVAAFNSSRFDGAVPSIAPGVGDYSGALRPQIHFSPPQNFMNDPSGCFLDQNGLWHLYYQCKLSLTLPDLKIDKYIDNPTDIVAGNQHWGHATSKDLYHWENQQIAIFATDDSQIFSGSTVIDVNNTSGFFRNQKNGVVAIYTLNTATEQVQEIAASYDGGYTFTKYAGNPVLTANSNQFRDPKVIRYGDDWVMVVSYAQDFVIGIFTSTDLKNWTHASNFSHHGLRGLQYECPNLVQMPVAGSDVSMYVLVISINPGAPLGGSITQYFPGSFNGTHFVPVDDATRLTDFAKDNYAGQFFYNVPEDQDPVFIAWASNWQYCQDVPTGTKEGWISAMSLPRRTHLVNAPRTGWVLISYAYDLTPLYDQQLANQSSIGNGSILLDYSTMSSGVVYFQCNITNIPNNTVAQGTLNFTFSSSSTKESVSGGIFLGGDTPFWLSRQNILGFGQKNPYFTHNFTIANPINEEGTFMLEGVIDRSILEMFLDGGRNAATVTFYPEGILDTLEVRAGGLNEGVDVSVAVWGLKSAWASTASPDGMVYGNLMTQMMRREARGLL